MRCLFDFESYAAVHNDAALQTYSSRSYDITVDSRTAIHSEKSRRLVLLSSFAEGLSSPTPPIPVHPRLTLHVPSGIFTRFGPFSRAALLT